MQCSVSGHSTSNSSTAHVLSRTGRFARAPFSRTDYPTSAHELAADFILCNRYQPGTSTFQSMISFILMNAWALVDRTGSLHAGSARQQCNPGISLTLAHHGVLPSVRMPIGSFILAIRERHSCVAYASGKFFSLGHPSLL